MRTRSVFPSSEKALTPVFDREESAQGFTRRRCLGCGERRLVARSLGICGRCKEAEDKKEEA